MHLFITFLKVISNTFFCGPWPVLGLLDQNDAPEAALHQAALQLPEGGIN